MTGNEQPPKANPQNGCTGCIGLVVLMIIVSCIADYAGCGRVRIENAATPNKSSVQETGLRRIGPHGAVAGYDNNGIATRIAPGTAVRATGRAYVDPMSGPAKIYVVTEGDWRGTPVALGEKDLEPQ